MYFICIYFFIKKIYIYVYVYVFFFHGIFSSLSVLLYISVSITLKINSFPSKVFLSFSDSLIK